MREIFEEVEGLLKGSKPFALATVVRTRGSTPQKPGSKMLVREDGTLWFEIAGHERAYLMWALQRMVHDLMNPPKDT